jgi:CheY-like chemotaxis protein
MEEASDFRHTEPAGFRAAGALMNAETLSDAKFIEKLCAECDQSVRSAMLSQELAKADKAHFLQAWRQISDSLARLSSLLSHGQKYAQASEDPDDKEPVALHTLLESRLTYFIPAFRDKDRHVRRKFKPFEFNSNRKMLTALIDACIEWGVDAGKELEFKMATAELPHRAKLVVKALTPEGAPAPKSPDGIAWHVVKRLGKTMDIKVDTLFGERENVLSLSITPAARVMADEGLSVYEAETNSREHTLEMSWEDAALVKGKRVLVVCDEPSLRLELSGVLRHARFDVFSATEVTQAMDQMSLYDINALVITKSLCEGTFKEMRMQLKQSNPRFPVIMLTSNEYSFYIASPFSDAPTTVDEKEIETQLIPALLLEMTRALRP